MLILGIVAVLLFGSRLPEVGRSLGKSLMEFKKGLRGIEDELRSISSSTAAETSSFDSVETEEEVGPRFAPPTSPSREESPPS